MINLDSRLLTELDENELFLLANLANRINGDRTCFPGNSLLCKELRWSKEKLQRIKKQLSEKGFVKIDTRHKDNGKGQTSNLYTILTPQVGNYTPGRKTDTGGAEIPAGGISENQPPPCLETGTRGGGKTDHELLITEALETERLTKEELEKEKKYILFLCIREVFEEIILGLYPQFWDFKRIVKFEWKDVELEKGGTTPTFDDVTDPTIRRTLQKIYAAAASLHSAYKELNRPIPAWRNWKSAWKGERDGQPDAEQEAADQVRAYAEYCRVTGTYPTKDPDKLAERVLQSDWCQMLKEYAEPRFPREYDPMDDFDGAPDFIIRHFYDEQLVFVDRQNPNRYF